MNLETNKIVSVNRPILKMFEAKIDELVGKGLIEFISEEDKEPLINDFYKLLHGEKAAFERRIELRTLKGNTITADCYLYINTNEAEEATELVVQISDITQLVKTTRENDIYVDMLTRQNDRLVNFAHIVSHNLRSHTSNISMLLGLMEFEEDQDEIHTQLMMLKKASNMLSETIQHLNEVIAIDIDTKEKERLNLKEHIDKSIEASQGLITGKEIQVNNAVAADVEVEASSFQATYNIGGATVKFAKEEKIATYFELFITVFCSPLVTKINKAPISGINIIAERIGKFI